MQTTSSITFQPTLQTLFAAAARFLGLLGQFTAPIACQSRPPASQATPTRAFLQRNLKEEILTLSQQGAVPSARIAVAALREMQRDPTQVDALAAAANRQIRAVRRCIAREIILHRAEHVGSLCSALAGREQNQQLKAVYKRALDRLRVECRRSSELVELHRLRNR